MFYALLVAIHEFGHFSLRNYYGEFFSQGDSGKKLKSDLDDKQ